MSPKTATAIAHPNIALIKYWGDLDSDLHIPANGSISMNLAELFTRTSVKFEQGLAQDQFTLNNQPADGIIHAAGEQFSLTGCAKWRG